MDIGVNCSFCQQLDFLPFTCNECKLVFCGDHRLRETHQCAVPLEPVRLPRLPANMERALLLFPDRAANMRVVDERLANATSQKLGIGSRPPTPQRKRALEKFTKFLSLQREKRNTPSKLLLSMLSKNGKNKGLGSITLDRPMTALRELRKSAKGPAKVSPEDRIYLWCVYVPSGTNNAVEESEASQLDIERTKKPVFVLKHWPVGRALDSIAETLAINNVNNGTLDAGERLHVCRYKENTEPSIVKTSDRCATTFKNGELIFLVRGTM